MRLNLMLRYSIIISSSIIGVRLGGAHSVRLDGAHSARASGCHQNQATVGALQVYIRNIRSIRVLSIVLE